MSVYRATRREGSTVWPDWLLTLTAPQFEARKNRVTVESGNHRPKLPPQVFAQGELVTFASGTPYADSWEFVS